jgi:hypothetical protein
MSNTYGDLCRNLTIRIRLIAQQLNVAGRLRLLPRKRYPGLTIVPLYRGPVSRFVGFLGFGE